MGLRLCLRESRGCDIAGGVVHILLIVGLDGGVALEGGNRYAAGEEFSRIDPHGAFKDQDG